MTDLKDLHTAVERLVEAQMAVMEAMGTVLAHLDAAEAQAPALVVPAPPALIVPGV